MIMLFKYLQLVNCYSIVIQFLFVKHLRALGAINLSLLVGNEDSLTLLKLLQNCA